MPVLRLMVGLPGSGKTTKSKAMTGFVRVCPDEVREEMHGGKFVFDRAKEPEVWRKVIGRVESELLAGHDVVVDATHVEPAARLRWVKMRASGVVDRLEVVVVLATIRECIQRVRYRGGRKAEVEKVIGRYVKAWSEPTRAEGFDAVSFSGNHRRSGWKARQRGRRCARQQLFAGGNRHVRLDRPDLDRRESDLAHL